MSWYLLHFIIFQTTILEYNCRWPIWQVFFHLIVNDTLKQQTTALEGLPVIICLMQTRILWWNGEAVIFYQRNKWLHQNVLCWRKYELIFVSTKWKMKFTGHVYLRRPVTPYTGSWIYESRSSFCKIHASHTYFGLNHASSVNPLAPSFSKSVWQLSHDTAMKYRNIKYD